MILTKHVLKSVTGRVNEIAKNDSVTVDALMRDIKLYILQSMSVKGISTDIAEEVAARLIVLVSLVEPMTVNE